MVSWPSRVHCKVKYRNMGAFRHTDRMRIRLKIGTEVALSAWLIRDWNPKNHEDVESPPVDAFN
jgi:hypothetical protein